MVKQVITLELKLSQNSVYRGILVQDYEDPGSNLDLHEIHWVVLSQLLFSNLNYLTEFFR